MLIYAKKLQLAYSEQLKITTQNKTKPYYKYVCTYDYKCDV